MNILVFDTETTSLDKPFCYDVGWAVVDSTTGACLLERHYVIEQAWHNLPLFESAYYKEKRPLYVTLMRQHKAIMDKWGYVMRQLSRDLRQYEISDAYAYNSQFDDKVFTFNNSATTQHRVMAAYSYVIIRDHSNNSIVAYAKSEPQYFNFAYYGNVPLGTSGN